MPIRSELDLRSGFVRSTVSGPVSVDQITDHCRALRRANAQRRPALVDARGLETHFSMGDLLRVSAAAAGEFAGESVQPCAIVVGESRQFEWARVVACLVAGWASVGAFTDPGEAERWLHHGVRTSRTVLSRVGHA